MPGTMGTPMMAPMDGTKVRLPMPSTECAAKDMINRCNAVDVTSVDCDKCRCVITLLVHPVPSTRHDQRDDQRLSYAAPPPFPCAPPPRHARCSAPHITSVPEATCSIRPTAGRGQPQGRRTISSTVWLPRSGQTATAGSLRSGDLVVVVAVVVAVVVVVVVLVVVVVQITCGGCCCCGGGCWCC